jgi:hypothetical protein
MNVDAVEERPGDLGDVALNHGRGTHALAGFVIEVTARLRVSSLLNLTCFICQ